MFKQYKVVGCEDTGNVKMNHVSSYFINLMADNIRKGRQTVVTIRAKLDDPDAVGREEVIIRDATFDKLTLMDWEAKNLQKMIMILLLQILKCLLLLTLNIFVIILFLKEIRRMSLVDVLLNSDVNEVLAEKNRRI